MPVSSRATGRTAEFPVDPIFLERWSPRAMSGAQVSLESLLSLFEAARWAPSSYNNQPWRFLYARRETPAWEGFLDLLAQGNRQWADKAAVLVVILSKKTFDRDGRPSRTHSFDTGAAWENLSLQANRSGLVVHGMEGFDYQTARERLGIPDEYDIEAMAAIGLPGATEELPERLQERERPSMRKRVEEIAFEGGFPR